MLRRASRASFDNDRDLPLLTDQLADGQQEVAERIGIIDVDLDTVSGTWVRRRLGPRPCGCIRYVCHNFIGITPVSNHREIIVMKVDRAGLRRRTKLSLDVEDEDSSYQHAFDHGKTPDDAANIAWIGEQLRLGNRWAWASVCVKARLCDLEGEASIGQCSYESEKAFRQCDYYEALVTEAVEELAVGIENLLAQHDIWVHDRVLCIECAAKPLSETT
jgi:hypothetical protein